MPVDDENWAAARRVLLDPLHEPEPYQVSAPSNFHGCDWWTPSTATSVDKDMEKPIRKDRENALEQQRKFNDDFTMRAEAANREDKMPTLWTPQQNARTSRGVDFMALCCKKEKSAAFLRRAENRLSGSRKAGESSASASEGTLPAETSSETKHHPSISPSSQGPESERKLEPPTHHQGPSGFPPPLNINPAGPAGPHAQSHRHPISPHPRQRDPDEARRHPSLGHRHPGSPPPRSLPVVWQHPCSNQQPPGDEDMFLPRHLTRYRPATYHVPQFSPNSRYFFNRRQQEEHTLLTCNPRFDHVDRANTADSDMLHHEGPYDAAMVNNNLDPCTAPTEVLRHGNVAALNARAVSRAGGAREIRHQPYRDDCKPNYRLVMSMKAPELARYPGDPERRAESDPEIQRQPSPMESDEGFEKVSDSDVAVAVPLEIAERQGRFGRLFSGLTRRFNI